MATFHLAAMIAAACCSRRGCSGGLLLRNPRRGCAAEAARAVSSSARRTRSLRVAPRAAADPRRRCARAMSAADAAGYPEGSPVRRSARRADRRCLRRVRRDGRTGAPVPLGARRTRPRRSCCAAPEPVRRGGGGRVPGRGGPSRSVQIDSSGAGAAAILQRDGDARRLSALPALELPVADGEPRERADAQRNRLEGARGRRAAVRVPRRRERLDGRDRRRGGGRQGHAVPPLRRSRRARAGAAGGADAAMQEQMIRGPAPLGPGAPPQERLKAMGPRSSRCSPSTAT